MNQQPIDIGDTIFDRVSTKNKHFTLWKYFLDVTGLGTWIINFIFDLDLSNDMSKEESYRIAYCLLMAAILSQNT